LSKFVSTLLHLLCTEINVILIIIDIKM